MRASILATFALAVASLVGLSWEEAHGSKRVKRQSGSFLQSQYIFRPTSCVPNVIAGQTNAPGANFYAIADTTPNPNIGVISNTGQVFVANYLTANAEYTATVVSYANQFKLGGILGSTQVKVICGSGSGGGTGTVPIASQPSYNFVTTNCNGGTVIGAVSVTNSANVVFGSANSGTPFLVSNNGQITLNSAISGTQTIYVTATNPYGTTTIPVTVTCSTSGGSGGTGTGGTGVVFPVFTQSFYSISPNTPTINSVIGTVAVFNPTGTIYSLASPSPFFAVNPQTGQITLIGNPPCGVPQNFAVIATNAAGTSSTTVSVTVPCGSSGGGGGTPSGAMRFPITSYTFVPTTTKCGPGGVVGQVSVIGAPGPVTYAIAGNSGAVGYTINPATGQIIAPSSGAGTGGTLIVTATSNGQTTTTTVFVNTAACTTTPITTCPAISQSSYTFTGPTGCSAFSTVGSIAATCPGSTVTYALTVNPSNRYGIDPTTGRLYATIPNTACNVLTVTVTAQDGSMRKASAPVYVDCRPGAVPGTCNAGTAGASGGSCIPGTFGCADIG